MKISLFSILILIPSICFAQQQQNSTQPNYSQQLQNQQTQNQNQQSQPQNTFVTPNLLESYNFGSFSPFSQPAAQQLQPTPPIQTINKNSKIQLPKSTLRIKVKIDIEYKKPNLVELKEKLYDRISRILITRENVKVSIDISNRTATIQGTVNSDEDLFLIQGLIALEPGIDKIIDLLTVLPKG